MKQFKFEYSDNANEDDPIPEFPTFAYLEGRYNFDDNSTWDAILNKFIEFLSACYGYDISKSVKYESFEERLDRLREEGVLGDPWEDEDLGVEDRLE